MSSIEKILKVTTNETTAVWLLRPISKTIQVRGRRHGEHSWRNKYEVLTTLSDQICTGTECSLENLPGAMDDSDEKKEKEKKRGRERESQGISWEQHELMTKMIYTYIYIYIYRDIERERDNKNNMNQKLVKP